MRRQNAARPTGLRERRAFGGKGQAGDDSRLGGRHRAAVHLFQGGRGLRQEGLLLTAPAKADETRAEAGRLSASSRPLCVNVHIAKTGFREGSISL
jgi:hypothetical protein